VPGISSNTKAAVFPGALAENRFSPVLRIGITFGPCFRNSFPSLRRISKFAYLPVQFSISAAVIGSSFFGLSSSLGFSGSINSIAFSAVLGAKPKPFHNTITAKR
jgi:hypothetical protein